jgi:uncharacterized membrane protein (UPF0127 family)
MKERPSTAGTGDSGGTGPARRLRDGTGALLTPAGGPVPVEIAASYRARTKGLLGRDGIAGALLLTPAASVHTLGMRFAIDVAYLDRRLRVRAVRTMRPGRLGLPRLRVRHVLEAEAGAFAAWGVRRGVVLGLVPDPHDPAGPDGPAASEA